MYSLNNHIIVIILDIVILFNIFFFLANVGAKMTLGYRASCSSGLVLRSDPSSEELWNADASKFGM